MREVLEGWTSGLPAAGGGFAVVWQLAARAELWELALRQRGAAPASAEAAGQVAAALAARAREAGFTVLFEPSVLLGGELVWPEGCERLALGPQAELLYRRRGQRTPEPIEAASSLDAARELTERSVLELGGGLEAIFGLAESQHQQVLRVASRFDTDGGLGEAVTGMEQQVAVVERTLSDALSGYTRDVEAASACAKDIAKLALAVGQIAQTARVLTFNARVESARLGDAGKGFIVIANAIREMANDVHGSNTLVASLATSLVDSLPELQRATTRLSATSNLQLAEVRTRLGALRTSFQEAREGAVAELRSTESAAATLRDRSQEVIRHLQFQDRSNQLLVRVRGQVEAMEAALGLDEARPEDLLERVGDLGRSVDGGRSLQQGGVELF